MRQRGEVWMVDLGLAQKVRPVLILNVPFGDADRAVDYSRSNHDHAPPNMS